MGVGGHAVVALGRSLERVDDSRIKMQAKKKPPSNGGLKSEADGTRTRNHRIDSPGL